MRRYVLILIFSLFTVSACSPKVYPSRQTDSVRVEYRERIIHDTAIVEVPKISEKIITADTISRLENDYAISEAIVSGSFLHHNLETKPHKVAVPITVTVRDTLYIEKASETIVQEVEKRLSWWQRFKMNAFWFMLFAILAYVVIRVYKLVNNA